MRQYEVMPVSSPVRTTVTVPGSKSITNRALLLAALAEGKSVIKGVLFSDDSRHFMECIRKLGFWTEISTDRNEVVLCGEGGNIPNKKAVIDVGSAGTAARFLTAFVGLSDGEYEVHSSPQMKKRPMQELFTALEQLGAAITYMEEPYAFPVKITGAKAAAPDNDVTRISLNIDRSSQFLSALLITSVMLNKELTIELTGKRSAKSYVQITERMMKEFGHGGVVQESDNCYVMGAGEKYGAREYQTEPDVSAACYFYAMAALTKGEVVVRHVTEASMQGDMRFLDVLEQLGCKKYITDSGEIRLAGEGNGTCQGIKVDMGDFSDQTMTLAALAPFAGGPVTITGVAHIRGQETNRISAIVTELCRMGINCLETEDGMVIYPGNPQPCIVNTYNDHRMAMAFSLIGLRTPGIVIDNPDCCAKTFEGYFSLLDDICREFA